MSLSAASSADPHPPHPSSSSRGHARPVASSGTPADRFLDSLGLPDSEKARTQLKQTEEKLANIQSILRLLQQTYETTMKNLPDNRDKERLLVEIQQNIQRHQTLVQRERAKLALKQDYAQNVLKVNHDRN